MALLKKSSIRGGKVKSIRSLKAGLKRSEGGFLDRIPAEGGLLVRFLTEPDEWVEFFEHYDEERKFYPCTDDCPGCAEGDRPSKRYLVAALDRNENKVLALVLPKTTAASVVKKYDKFGTLLDRDYDLSREGSGRETTYDVTPEAPSVIKNLGKYEAPDLLSKLEAQLPGGSDDEDEEEEDEKPTRRSRGTAAPRRRSTIEDDDDDEDDDDRPARGGAVRRPAKVIRKPAGSPGKKVIRRR